MDPLYRVNPADVSQVAMLLFHKNAILLKKNPSYIKGLLASCPYRTTFVPQNADFDVVLLILIDPIVHYLMVQPQIANNISKRTNVSFVIII